MKGLPIVVTALTKRGKYEAAVHSVEGKPLSEESTKKALARALEFAQKREDDES